MEIFENCESEFLNKILKNDGVEILGFDFGHGETTISKLVYDSTKGGLNVSPLKIHADSNSSKIPTYLFIDNNQKAYIGDEAFDKKNNDVPGDFFDFFKRMPSLSSAFYPKTKYSYKKLMHIFVKKCLEAVFSDENMLNNNMDKKAQYILFFGRPAGDKWEKEEEEYKNILVCDSDSKGNMFDLNISGINISPCVYVISESFSSISSAINSNAEIHPEEDVVCIDLGSSTTDVSVIRNGKPIYDRGISLGGHHLDKNILSVVLKENNKTDSDLFDAFIALAEARKSKENYYSNGGSPKLIIELKNGDLLNKRLNDEFMEKVFFDIPVVFNDKNHATGEEGYASWAAACAQFLKAVRTDFVNCRIYPKRIVLTGGVSNIPLIEGIVKSVFDQNGTGVNIIKTEAPSYSVSNGLAYLAQYQAKAVIAKRLVMQELPEIIRDCMGINNLSGSLADKIMPIFVEQTCESLKYWVDHGDYTTLNTVMLWVANAMQNQIKNNYFTLRDTIDNWLKKKDSINRNEMSKKINQLLKQNLNINIPVLQVEVPEGTGSNVADGLQNIDIDLRDSQSLKCYLSPWGFGIIIDLNTNYTKDGGFFNNRTTIYNRALERKKQYKDDVNFKSSIVNQIAESETIDALVSIMVDVIYQSVLGSIETLAIYSCRIR